MTTLDAIKSIKIDLTQGLVEQDQSCAGSYEFEITPKEFLNYSKQDFKSNDQKGNINALTNAKRAIDCQTDKLFYSIGLDPNNFPNNIVEEFISKSKNSPKKDLPIRLRLLQAINFAPAKIVSDVRQIRHALEHHYKNPSDEEVSGAIELAELFIQATDSKLRNMVEFGLTDRPKSILSDGHIWDSIWFHYKSDADIFEVSWCLGKERQQTFTIENTSVEFYYILKIATSFEYFEDTEDAVIDWLEFIRHPIPRQHIKIDRDY
ncbi:MAG: hypothetical protein V4547_19180 [Bacteroidota bacterium]